MRFWTAIIKAIGINIIMGRRMPFMATLLVVVLLIVAEDASFFVVTNVETVVTTDMMEPLGDLKSVDLYISFGAG